MKDIRQIYARRNTVYSILDNRARRTRRTRRRRRTRRTMRTRRTRRTLYSIQRTSVSAQLLGFTIRGCASLFRASHSILRLRKIRRKYKTYQIGKHSHIYKSRSCICVMFLRSVLYVLSGAYYIYYMRNIQASITSSVVYAPYWARFITILFICSAIAKRKRKRKCMRSIQKKNKFAVYVRYRKCLSFLKKECIRFAYGLPVVYTYTLRLFYATCSMTLHDSVLPTSNTSQIIELLMQRYNRRAQLRRVDYYSSVLKVSMHRALSYSNYILPLRKSFWSPDKLLDFLLLLVSLDVDLTRISYRDVVTILMRGRYKGRAINDDIYKDNTRSKSKSKHRGGVTKYTKTADSLGKIGIVNSLFFDLSFFLKLNYDMDLFKFYSFCKCMCSSSTKLGTVL